MGSGDVCGEIVENGVSDRLIRLWRKLKTESWGKLNSLSTVSFQLSTVIAGVYYYVLQTREKYLAHEYHRCGVGLNHIAFHADSPATVDAIAGQLRARGAAMLYDEKYPHAGGDNCYAVFFEDPDRIKIEITAR